MSPTATFSIEHRDGCKFDQVHQRKQAMSYEAAVSPVLAVVFILIAFMAILARFVPRRFHEAIISVIIAGVTIQFILLLPIWVVYI
jgi:heme/copper-type cytochrome/quinol oxidase subunit 4